ncbi:DUF2829 domain-containing protein [Parabacteroides goldsteinii]|uniref:DUF2829 domain-containing protein n=1 Tax=Parabacteroides goldsteinii TaxID=328812 RepID=UPI0025B652F9|nr:DUF2829 domain-containing protein [Parabacteroides goldsteinii]
MKYVKKSVVVEAVQYDNLNKKDIEQFVGKELKQELFSDSAYEVGMGAPIFSLTIPTLEGEMKALPGDYIIKGVSGEFYPCKPDIFKKTYREADPVSAMNFGDAIEILRQGGAIRRSGWNGKGLFVIKQVPAHIESDIIPKMQSLPQSAKDLIMRSKGFVDYTSQCLIYNENNGRADSWVPSISDVFAEDWEVVK